jgi:uncharacterized SAM-binding protein YcdF (DUF218 family)
VQTLKALLVSLLLPPSGFVTLALVALLLRSGKWSRCLLWVAVVGLIAFSTPIVSASLLVALESGLDTVPPASDPPQAIVVLGAEIARVPGDPPYARVGPLTLERLRAAAELARRTDLPVLVTGGTVQLHEPPVGILMAEAMTEDFRVPVRWTESKSRDTWENATLSAAILRAEGIHSIYVVTHPWHMKRALQAFAPTGLVVTAAPTPLDSGITLTLSDFMPRVSMWLTGYFAMHEWVGRIWYELR